MYRLLDTPRRLEDFAPGCHYHQTSPHSTFTQHTIWSIALPAGRVTVTDTKLIETRKGERTETEIDNPEAVLRERFSVDVRWPGN